MKKIEDKKEKLIEAPKRSARAVAKYLRISPRKMRLVINAIRHEPTGRAFHILMTLKKKAARMTEKLLKSAVANAKVLGLEENRLYVSNIRADGGPTMKRFMSRSMGRADRIIKRTTHLSMIVTEGNKSWAGSANLNAKLGEKGETGSAKVKVSSKKKTAAAGAKA